MGKRVNLFMAIVLGSAAWSVNALAAAQSNNTYTIQGGSIQELKNNTVTHPITCHYQNQSVTIIRHPDKNNAFFVTENGWNASQTTVLMNSAKAAQACENVVKPRPRPSQTFTMTVGGTLSELQLGHIARITCESVNQQVSFVRTSDQEGSKASYMVFEKGWRASRVTTIVSPHKAAEICENVKKPRKSWLNLHNR